MRACIWQTYRVFCAALAIAAASGVAVADTPVAVEAEPVLLASVDADLGLAARPSRQADTGPIGGSMVEPFLRLETSLALLLILSATALGAYYWWRYRVLHAEFSEHRLTEFNSRRSEQGYRALIEAAPFPIVITCARTGRIRFLNERSAEYFGIGREQILGRSISEFCQDADLRNRLVRRLGEDGRLNDVELPLHDAKGRFFWGLMSAKLVEFEGRAGVFVALNDISERKNLEARLEHLVNTDTLTTLASRRRILEILDQEYARSTRYVGSLTILTVDLDHFKEINDTYGHAAGDEVLRAFAGVLSSGLRNHDSAGRMGGEEFMVVLPETGPDEALLVAERLREAVEELVVCLDKKIIRLTVSIGVASLDTCASVEELMKSADHALYAAKDAGRNRVVLHACPLQ